MTTSDGEDTSLNESEPDINLVTLIISAANLSEMAKPVTNDEVMCICNHWADRGGWGKRVSKG